MSLEIIQESTFRSLIQEKKTFLLTFSAAWCPPCRAMAPELELFSKNHPAFPVYKVDIDASPQLASDHKILSIPTTVIYKNGSLVAQKTGGMTASDLADWTENHH